MQDKDVLYAIELKKAICERPAKDDSVLSNFVKLDNLLAWYIDAYGSSKETTVSDYRSYEMAIHNDLVKAVRHSDFPSSISLIRKARELIQAELDRKVDASLLSYDIYNRLTGYLNSSYSDMLTCYVSNVKDRSYFMKQGEED